jgi:hypothetical protein
MKSSTWIGTLSLFAAFLVPGTGVLASGSTPALSQMPIKFKDHGACVAALEEQRAGDQQLAQPSPVRTGERTHHITIQPISKAVERKGARRAVYAARMWSHNGIEDLENGRLEITHSWQETSSECRGKTLTRQVQNGFSQPTFEPLAHGGG